MHRPASLPLLFALAVACGQQPPKSAGVPNLPAGADAHEALAPSDILQAVEPGLDADAAAVVDTASASDAAFPSAVTDSPECAVDADCPVTEWPCFVATCTAHGECAYLPSANGEPCDDGTACTAGDRCLFSKCISTTALVCDDGNVCTDDACEAETGCTHAANGSLCKLGWLCAPGQCEAGSCSSVQPCDDGDLCTLDTCDSATGSCVTAATACDDGNPCTDDGCVPASGCVHTPNQSPCMSVGGPPSYCVAGSCVEAGHVWTAHIKGGMGGHHSPRVIGLTKGDVVLAALPDPDASCQYWRFGTGGSVVSVTNGGCGGLAARADDGLLIVGKWFAPAYPAGFGEWTSGHTWSWIDGTGKSGSFSGPPDFTTSKTYYVWSPVLAVADLGDSFAALSLWQVGSGDAWWAGDFSASLVKQKCANCGYSQFGGPTTSLAGIAHDAQVTPDGAHVLAGLHIANSPVDPDYVGPAGWLQTSLSKPYQFIIKTFPAGFDAVAVASSGTVVAVGQHQTLGSAMQRVTPSGSLDAAAALPAELALTRDITATADGGFAVVGLSVGPDPVPLVVRIAASGQVSWQTKPFDASTFGGAWSSKWQGIARLADGGFAVVAPHAGNVWSVARIGADGSTVPPACDDADPCTTDGWVPGKGCTHVPNDGLCSAAGGICEAGKCVP